MKKQILVFAALLVAVFFTACEQDALVNPVEDVVETQNLELSDLPSEAIEGLQAIIDGNYVAPELEERSIPFPEAYIVKDDYVIWAANLFCPINLDISATNNRSYGSYFYFHVDQKHANGNYYNQTHSGNLVYGTSVRWEDVVYARTVANSYSWRCNYRAYVYMWDPSNSRWTRLAVKYF